MEFGKPWDPRRNCLLVQVATANHFSMGRLVLTSQCSLILYVGDVALNEDVYLVHVSTEKPSNSDEIGE